MAARSKQIAKGVLDDIEHAVPDSKTPEQERADRELLEKFYIATGEVEREQVVGRLLAELADRIERLSPAGSFAPIEIPLRLDDRRGVLRFAPSPSKPGKRIVELSIASESGLSTSSQWLDTGSNEELVSYLRRPEVVADTLATADELARSLSRHRLA